MKPTVECNICCKRGDADWAGAHKEYIGHNDFNLLCGDSDEPPSESDKNNFKLRISRSRDLYSTIARCQPLVAGNNNFRSLVMFGSLR